MEVLWSLILVLLATSSEFAAASVKEGEQLLAIKRGIQNSNPLTSWIEGTNPCQSNWYGIACAEDTVSELDLSNLFLKGSIPSQSFTNLPRLTKVLLANNSFSGVLPQSLFQLTNLDQLDISYNSFSGPLPSGLEQLTKLQVLSLTGNPFRTSLSSFNFSLLTELRYVLISQCDFVDTLPPGLTSLPNLYALDLESNSFTGELSTASLLNLPSLKILGLANSGLSVNLSSADIFSLRQLLYVSLPEELLRSLPAPLQSLVQRWRNTLLCTYVKWIRCDPGNPSTPSPGGAPVPDSAVSPDSRRPKSLKKKKEKNKTGAIVGGVVGSVAFLVATSCLGAYFIIRKRSNLGMVTDFTTKAGLELDVVTVSQSFVVAHAFTYGELEQATDGFNIGNLLGEGSFGQVFRGVLTNGKVAAIKRMDACPSQYPDLEREFRIEVDLLSRFNHPNLVRLFGYCADGKHRLLVYEFLSGGSLESYFQGRSRQRHGSKLDFRRRLLIALGSAKGLAFLHAGGEEGNPIIHRDFKASNILLDEYFTPKISDFGFAKLLNRTSSHASTRVIGTFGYFDPHYTSTGRLTVKADVYGFGVVLLQLLTGKPAVVSLREGEDPENIVSWSKQFLEDRRKLKRILDKDLGVAYPQKCAQRLALLAACCLRENADGRPTMVQCVKVIEELLVECAMHLESVSP